MPELPPPLPPGERTVGQLSPRRSASTATTSGARCRSGCRSPCSTSSTSGAAATSAIALFLACAPFLALAFAYASRARRDGRAAARGRSPSRPRSARPCCCRRRSSSPGSRCIAAAYLAFVGLAVPVAVLEGAGLRAALRRALELGRADYVHALGSLAALVIVFFLSRQVLVSLLHGQADETIRVAVFLADLVLAPLMLLGDGDALLRPGGAGRRRADEPEPRRTLPSRGASVER